MHPDWSNSVSERTYASEDRDEFAILAGEPIEAAVKPGDGFQGGVLPPADQTKLQAAVIGAFAEATSR